jgi:hypothetical protein
MQRLGKDRPLDLEGMSMNSARRVLLRGLAGLLLVLGWPAGMLWADRGEGQTGLDRVQGPPEQADAGGKYRTLLRVLHCPQDLASYTRFTDWGPWTGTEWHDHKNLPPGHWVYVYPHWYIWRDKVR